MIVGDSEAEVPFFFDEWVDRVWASCLFVCLLIYLLVCPEPTPPQNRLASSIPFTFSEEPLYVLDYDLHFLYSSFWLTYTSFQ